MKLPVPRWSLTSGRLLLVMALVVIACLARVVVLGQRMFFMEQDLHPPRLHVTAVDEEKARLALGQLEAVAFTTRDGLRLHGWFKPGASRAAVVFLHGKGNNRMVLLAEAAEVSRRGMGVLLYDSRASGESEGSLQSWGEFEQMDLLAALDYLSVRPDVDPQRLGAFGFSVGATTVALLGVHDQRLHALVLSGIGPSLEKELWFRSSRPKTPVYWWITRVYADAGVHLDQLRPIDHMAALAPRPLLFVMGDHDKAEPLEFAQSVYEAALMPKERLVIEGGDHNDYLERGGQRYLDRIGNFFNRTLVTGYRPLGGA